MTMTASQALRAPRVPAGSGARAAAFFDLDGTLIPGSATIPLARAAFRAGMVTPPELVRDLRHGVSFLLQGATDERSEAVRDRILAAVTGRTAQEMVALSEGFIPDLVASITPAMGRVLGEHATAGRDRIVLSASPTEIVSRLADSAGLERGTGTASELDADGRYTGRLDGPFCYGPGKAEILRALAAREGYDLSASYAYSDSLSDLPMLEAVGHPVAVNPEPELRDLAEERGWPIVETSRVPRVSVSDPHSWVRMGQRLTVASIGSLIALGTRPIEALGGIDGDAEDDAPAGGDPDRSAATAA
jgi:HAD superfamily hydrolase (TIGR01490 family)